VSVAADMPVVEILNLGVQIPFGGDHLLDLCPYQMQSHERPLEWSDLAVEQQRGRSTPFRRDTGVWTQNVLLYVLGNRDVSMEGCNIL
jgi:hypothetical protein